MPYLPANVMEALARAALAAEECSTHAWRRLSLVSRTWRHTLRGDIEHFTTFVHVSAPACSGRHRVAVSFMLRCTHGLLLYQHGSSRASGQTRLRG